MFWSVSEKYRDVGMLILRLGFGLGFFFYHGLGKLIGGPERWANSGDVMSRIGIDFGHTFFGFMAAFSESIGGLLIATGFFFRPMSALLCSTMVMASVSHYASGRGNPGHAVKNASLFLALIFTGPGKYSLDHWIAHRGKTETGVANGLATGD
ncbi:DoxX family protein [Acidobacteria bacterium AH-259-A15]|nr:DoxX family protein [Acidobacteria bacterium AH-259-A15]